MVLSALGKLDDYHSRPEDLRSLDPLGSVVENCLSRYYTANVKSSILSKFW